jgi:hypothetical protein
MTAFPSLTPSTRTFIAGARPISEATTLNGGEERTGNSNAIVGQSLKLAFKGITEAQALLIVAHYNGQQGAYQSFAIPDVLLSGLSAPAAITPTGYAWVYATSPVVNDAPLFCEVTVELTMVRV